MKIIEWNLHKMTNSIEVEDFVKDSIIKENPDIICLVEYLTDEKIETALENEYWICESNTISGNKIFIGVKKSLAKKGIEVIVKNEVEDCYNFLHVDFEKKNGQTFSVIGVRMLSPIDASIQTKPLLKYLKQINNSFICTGDFNILDKRMERWFPEIKVSEITSSELSRYSYIYTDSDKLINGLGSIDHILHSDDISSNSKYNWDFLSLDNHYPDIKEIKCGNRWSIEPGYPDHAMLISEIKLKEN